MRIASHYYQYPITLHRQTILFEQRIPLILAKLANQLANMSNTHSINTSVKLLTDASHVWCATRQFSMNIFTHRQTERERESARQIGSKGEKV